MKGESMKKHCILLIISLLLATGAAMAAETPDLTFAPAEVGPSRGHATVVIPERAVQVSPDLFYLGTSVDGGRKVEGYAFIHRRDNHAKPGTECGNNICEPGENKNKCPQDCGGGGGDDTDTSSCYSLLAKGAKWRTIEPYYINPANNSGIDPLYIADRLDLDIGNWEAAADYYILGSGYVTSETLAADTEATDGYNEVYFADISEPGAIGVTIVWGIFYGSPFTRELVEWDQVYDDVDFAWSTAGEAGKMDFENIATHELGHSMGLGDLYDDKCSLETMYGYADYGETKKRTLEAGDIAGINELY
jgi:hypothetical protein